MKSQRNCKPRWFVLATTVLLTGCATDTGRSGYSEIPVDYDVVLNLLECARIGESRISTAPKSVKIDGVHRTLSPVFRADEVLFSAGGTLQFVVDRDNEYRRPEKCRNTVFLIANRIEVQQMARAAYVTWYEDGINEEPFERGQAPSGAFGAGPGLPGGRGTDGAQGNSGLRGLDSPTLIALVGKSDSNDLKVNLTGGTGGRGGLGQTGGVGGRGGNGATARNTVLGCERSPTAGGRGGDGGNGGAGGAGGVGGNGGNFVLITGSEYGSYMLEVVVELDLNGGQGGEGGDGGLPGMGGTGGKAGQGSAFCGGSKPSGQDGQPGKSGPKGKKGSTGLPGKFGFLRLDQGEFEKIFEQVR